MLRVRPFQQSPSMCGPAALKMVLAFFGVQKTERALARLSGATRAKGVPGKGLVHAARTLGLRARIKDRCSFADLHHYVTHRKIPVIVDWFLENDGHYAVVVALTRTHITLQDPAIGRRRTMDLVTFKRVWFDFEGPHLRKPKDIILRRMIVVVDPLTLALYNSEC